MDRTSLTVARTANLAFTDRRVARRGGVLAAAAVSVLAATVAIAGAPSAGAAGAAAGTAGTSAAVVTAAPTTGPFSSAAGPAADIELRHRRATIEGLDVFYREAGPRDAPVVLLLHGFPTSSHMFRNLIPELATRYHVIAPDYPGFGQSSMPSVTEFEYTFDRLTDIVEQLVVQLGVDRYSLYLMDYGAPVGYRLAMRHPERIESLVVQNGNAYEEGLETFWDPIRAYWADRSESNATPLRGFFGADVTRWQYVHGTRDPEAISPDTWTIDQRGLDRPGNHEIQLALFYDYGSNPDRYPAWQAWLREAQPPTLITWGRNDHIFPMSGAMPYLRDLPNAELHLLDTGHFALEEDGPMIAALMLDFLDRSVPRD